MVNKTGQIFLFICITILLIAGCEKNSFKHSCYEARKILEDATSLLVPSINNNNKNSQRNIVVSNDNSEAIEYLRRRENDLVLYFNQVKRSIDSTGENNNDAIYAAAYINELYYFLTGKVLDDRCYYLKLVNNNKEGALSSWLIDDFFAPLNKGLDYKESWKKMGDDKKRTIILRTLSAANSNCG